MPRRQDRYLGGGQSWYDGRARALIAGDPSLVHAKGGDGKRPLHFARTIQIARFLLEHAPRLTRSMRITIRPRRSTSLAITRGCGIPRHTGARSDLLLAAALGDLALVRRHLDADPGAIAMRVDQDWFPMVDTAPNVGISTNGRSASTSRLSTSRASAATPRSSTCCSSVRVRLFDLLDALWAATMHAPTPVLAADPQLVARAPEKGFAPRRRRRPE